MSDETLVDMLENNRDVDRSVCYVEVTKSLASEPGYNERYAYRAAA
jgi:hypothetical protein